VTVTPLEPVFSFTGILGVSVFLYGVFTSIVPERTTPMALALNITD